MHLVDDDGMPGGANTSDRISLEYQSPAKQLRLSTGIARALAIMALVLVGVQVPWIPFSVYAA